MSVSDSDGRFSLRALEEAGERLTERSKVLHLLEREWADAQWMLAEFRGLFSDGERLALLNGVAGPLLYLVQRVFEDDLLLRVARLTDDVGRGGQRNLTVQQIPDLFRDEPERRSELVARVKTTVDAAKFARPLRNKLIAHRDYSLARDPEAKPLERASLEDVGAALMAIGELLAASLDRELLPPFDAVAADRFFCRTKELVDAVQFVGSLIDPKPGSDQRDEETVSLFLQKVVGRPEERRDHERVVQLRLAAKRYPPAGPT